MKLYDNTSAEWKAGIRNILINGSEWAVAVGRSIRPYVKRKPTPTRPKALYLHPTMLQRIICKTRQPSPHPKSEMNDETVLHQLLPPPPPHYYTIKTVYSMAEAVELDRLFA